MPKLLTRKRIARKRGKTQRHPLQNKSIKKTFWSYFKGGDGAKLEAMPNQVYSFPSGCSSASDCAQSYLDDMSAKQHEQNMALKGGKRMSKRSSSKRMRNKRMSNKRMSSRRKSIKRNKSKHYFIGGDDGDYYPCEKQDTNWTTVSQFSSNGPEISPINANTSSIATNMTLIANKNNALNDCYATDSCPVKTE
jgi:hypothetical protein